MRSTERPAPGEHLWHLGWSGAVCTHAVLRKTATRTYYRAWCTPDRHGDLGPVEFFDRRRVEADGHVRHIGVLYFWSSPAAPPPAFVACAPAPAPAHLRALGLRWPCTRSQVVQAFRRRVQRAHPDHGGTAARFIALRSAYETVLAAVGGTP